MDEIFKFPNGHDVVVVRKQGILDCIDDNIIDKEIALEIVRRCELDCITFLNQGRWASIPFLGNIRVPKDKQLLKSEEQQSMISSARENYGLDEYVMFRRQLAEDNEKKIRTEREFNYKVSTMANRYPKLFKNVVAKVGIHAAKVVLFGIANANVVNEEHIIKHYSYYDKFQIDN